MLLRLTSPETDKLADSHRKEPFPAIEESEKQGAPPIKGTEEREDPEAALSFHEDKIHTPSGADAHLNGRGAYAAAEKAVEFEETMPSKITSGGINKGPLSENEGERIEEDKKAFAGPHTMTGHRSPQEELEGHRGNEGDGAGHLLKDKVIVTGHVWWALQLLKNAVLNDEVMAITFKDKRYTMAQILEIMNTSSQALAKLGIGEIVWRQGNIYNDFVNELILYDEAKKSGMRGDAEKARAWTQREDLTPEESVSIEKFLAISTLINEKIKNAGEEKTVEVLLLRNQENGKEEKVSIYTTLEDHARNGRPFEEISKMYPHSVQFRVMRLQELDDWIRGAAEHLQEGEVGTVKTRDGYLMMKPVTLSQRSAGDVPKERNQNNAFVMDFIEKLQKEAGQIEIAFSRLSL